MLESCKDSKVFRPPNPWLMGILRLLAEVHQQDKIKLNIRFEIELCFKDFGMAVTDVKADDSLPGRARVLDGNQDFISDKPSAAAAAAAEQGRPGQDKAAAGPDGVAAAPAAGVPVAPALPTETLNLQSLIASIQISPQLVVALGPLSDRIPLRKLVFQAIDRLLLDFGQKLMEGPRTIAVHTTRELVTKDFAGEPDEMKVYRPAVMMCSALASGLSQAAARDLVPNELFARIRALLQQLSLEATLVENTARMLANDNLEIAVMLAEHLCVEKAVKDVETQLAPQLQARQAARAMGQQIAPALGEVLAKVPALIPDSLRPKPLAQLTPAQQRVYEDFTRPRLPGQPPQPAAGPAVAAAATAAVAAVAVPGSMPGAARVPAMAVPSSPVIDHNKLESMAASLNIPTAILEKLTVWQSLLDRQIAAQEPAATIKALGEGSDLSRGLLEIADLIPAGPNREMQGISVAKLIFKHLFSDPAKKLHVSAYCSALEVLRDRVARRLTVDVTNWYWCVCNRPAPSFRVGLLTPDLLCSAAAVPRTMTASSPPGRWWRACSPPACSS